MARLPQGLDYNSANVNLTGYNPPPGPQQPGKYKVAPGLAYQRWGEQTQAGYIYNPYTDTYEPDPVAQQKYYEDSGLSPKKPKQPGALEGLGTIAAGGAALYAGQAFGKDPSKFVTNISSGFGNVGSGIKNTLGLGSQAGTETVGAASSGGAGATAPAASPGGLLGVGQAGVAPGVPALINGIPGASVGTSGIGPVVSGAEYNAALGGSFGPAASGAEYGASLQGANTAAAAAPSGFSLSGIGGAGNFLLPAAGALGAYDVLSHDVSPARGALEGAASGAAMGSYFGPPGAVVGGIAGGLIGLGKSLFQSKHEWKQEKNKLNKLSEGGTFIPPGLIESMPTKGRKLEDLIVKDLPADFVGRDPQGNWVNNKFATTRNVKDLQGTDIVNYSAFAENDPQWFTKPLDERIAIADQALAAGAVKEHHGTIDVNFSKFTPGQAPAPQPGQPPAPAPTPPPAIGKPLVIPAPGQTQPGGLISKPLPVQEPPKAQQNVPGSNVTYGTVARGGTQPTPPKGTRVSPGVYADGRGGTYRQNAAGH